MSLYIHKIKNNDRTKFKIGLFNTSTKPYELMGSFDFSEQGAELAYQAGEKLAKQKNS